MSRIHNLSSRINVNSVRFCKTTNKLNVSLCCNFTFVSV